MKKKSSAFINEFKKFISQGNVMDLAVGVVIGSAFSGIVTSLVNDIIMPVVGLVIGGVDFSDLYIRVPNIFGGNTAATIYYGNFLQSVVNFLVIAFSLFLVVKALNKMKERSAELAKKALKKEDKEEEKKEDKKNDAIVEQTKLLKEIRDELKKKK